MNCLSLHSSLLVAYDFCNAVTIVGQMISMFFSARAISTIERACLIIEEHGVGVSFLELFMDFVLLLFDDWFLSKTEPLVSSREFEDIYRTIDSTSSNFSPLYLPNAYVPNNGHFSDCDQSRSLFFEGD